MPSDLALKAMNTVHRALLILTGGRLGWRIAGMPVLELTTVGRRSGEPRTVLLTSPYQDGDSWVLVASRGGDDRHPAWFLNLREHSVVHVRVGGGDWEPMRARVADDEERRRLWPLVVASFGSYESYQGRTERQIPLVLLTPLRRRTASGSRTGSR